MNGIWPFNRLLKYAAGECNMLLEMTMARTYRLAI